MEVNVSTSSGEGAQILDPRRWLMLVVVLCASLMSTIDEFIVNVAIPSIERELHTSFAEMQLVVAGYTLVYAVLLVTGGRLGDIYGRKRLFLLGVGLFTLSSALCGFAPSPLLLIIFRITKGVGAAMMAPQVVSFIQVGFAPAERPTAFGMVSAVSGLASVVGQVLGGFLIAANLFGLGWRIIFLVNVPIGLVALLAGMLLIRESRVETEQASLDYGGVALLSITLFLFVFPIVIGGEAGWPLWSILCLLLSIPFMLVFLVYEYRRKKRGKLPLVSLSLFRSLRFPSGLITVLLSSSLFSGLLFLLAFYLQTMLHFTPLLSGFVFMASSISFILASSLSPRVTPRLGVLALPLAAVLVTVSYLLTVLAAQFFVPMWGMTPLLVGLFFLGSGMGLLVTPLMHRTLEGIGTDDVGSASGIYMTVMQLAAALGVAVIGMIFSLWTANTGSPLAGFVGSLIVTTILSLLLLITVFPLRRPPTQ